MEDILQQVRELAIKQILFLPHALRQMSRLDRMITTHEVRETVMTGGLIEDARGHSCLLLKSMETDRIIHVVCAPKPEYLAIITAYIPSSNQWTNNFRERL